MSLQRNVWVLAAFCCVVGSRVVLAQQPNVSASPVSDEKAAAPDEVWTTYFNNANTLQWVLARANAPEQVGTHWIGAEVEPATAALRSQLGLADDQGLVVSWIHQGSPAAQAGLESHDVILQLADQTVSNSDELAKKVDVIGEKPAGLLVLRQGKRMTLQVKPMPARRLQGVALDQLARVTLNASQQSRYWIGVELGAPEETLRSQLKLAPDQGVVVVNVVDDGPAAKAGTKKHDVFLSFSDNPIASAEDVRVKLQEIGEKPIAVKLLREGKPLLIEVTPEKHQEPALAEYTLSLTQPEVRQPLTVEVVRPALVAHSYRAFTDQALFLGTRVQPPAPADPQTRIQELVEEMKQLQKKLEALGEEIKKQRESAPASGK